MAESVTGENSSDNLHMQTVSRGRSKCPWRGLEVEHLGEIFRFFVVIALKVRSAILNVISVPRRGASAVWPEPG